MDRWNHYFWLRDLESTSNILKEDNAALAERVQRLENHAHNMDRYIQQLEFLLAQHGIAFSREEPPAPAEPKPVGEPVTFPARTEETILCPCCSKKQKGNRNACYSCGTPFLYETD